MRACSALICSIVTQLGPFSPSRNCTFCSKRATLLSRPCKEFFGSLASFTNSLMGSPLSWLDTTSFSHLAISRMPPISATSGPACVIQSIIYILSSHYYWQTQIHYLDKLHLELLIEKVVTRYIRETQPDFKHLPDDQTFIRDRDTSADIAATRTVLSPAIGPALVLH